MINKQIYEAPEAENLPVLLERSFLDSEWDIDGSSFGEKGNVKDLSDDVWDWQ